MKKWHIAAMALALVILVAGCSGAATTTQPSASTAASSPAQSSKPSASTADQKTASPAASDKQPATVEEKLAAANQLAPDARQAKLIEEAKKEGKVVLYMVADNERFAQLEKAFKAKYPFLNAEFSRVTSEQGIQQALAETKAGKQLADVLVFGAVEFYELQKNAVVGTYLSPERKAFNPAFMDKDGYWTTVDATPEVIGYNKDLVKPADVPKTLQDLLDPKWNGKLGRTRHGGRWLAATMKVMGDDKALDFAQKLSQQNVTLAESNSALAQFVGSGEVALCFDIHSSVLTSQMKKGAPIGIQFIEPMYFAADVAGLAKNAPHPYSAALLVDWLLSKESQEIGVKYEWMGGRTDVTYPFADEMKPIKTSIAYNADLVQDKYNDFQSKFESMFIRR